LLSLIASSPPQSPPPSARCSLLAGDIWSVSATSDSAAQAVPGPGQYLALWIITIVTDALLGLLGEGVGKNAQA
jgi:hypothetical protein